MVVPWLFWFEIRNILVVNERRGRIDVTDADHFLSELSKLIAEVDDEPDGSAVMKLARSYQLTVYDAAYLELASRRKLSLCTLDKQLIAAAPKSGVNLWPR
jgi:predicted nucleic acid-binding protein